MQLTFSNKKHKVNWSWDDIYELEKSLNLPKLTVDQAEIYIARAKRQMSQPTDIGTVDAKDNEVYRKAYFKKMGWDYKPLPEGKSGKSHKRKKLTGWIAGK